MKTVDEQLAVCLKGAVQLTPLHHWEEKLEWSIDNGPLVIKLGFDPTAPDIHFGHVVVLNKLRDIQDLGHAVVIVIGDFTAAIGDPSGRNSTRPQLSAEQIRVNAETYCEQVFKILDKSKTTVRYNSEWLGRLTARQMVELTSKFTVARMLERTDFANRLTAQQSISVHEFLYPLLQGYDSVALESDLELGGTDQTFNLLVGRHLQDEYGLSEMGHIPQCILTMPLLVGTDGTMKMSKSKDNYIGVSEHPDSMFAKVMSISDRLMWDWIPLLGESTPFEVNELQRECALSVRNVYDVKVSFAKFLVDKFHGQGTGQKAYDDFIHRSKGGIPEVVPDVHLDFVKGKLIGAILKESGLTPSVSEANRKIEQKGVRIDQVVVEDKGLVLDPGVYVLQVGKRNFVRLHLVR